MQFEELAQLCKDFGIVPRLCTEVQLEELFAFVNRSEASDGDDTALDHEEYSELLCVGDPFMLFRCRKVFYSLIVSTCWCVALCRVRLAVYFVPGYVPACVCCAAVVCAFR